MSHLRLEALQEKLLCAGIAPRHVRRYLRELHQHFDDLLRVETENGLSGKAAFEAARKRLGTDDELAFAMLAQPELRSYTACYPWAVFGITPVFVLIAALLLAFMLQGLLVGWHWDWTHRAGAIGGYDAPGPKAFFNAWNWVMTFVFPVLVAGVFCLIAVRQRMRLGWLIFGAVVLALLGTVFSFETKLVDAFQASELSVGAGFSTSTTPLRLAINITLIGAMIAVCRYWRRREIAD